MQHKTRLSAWIHAKGYSKNALAQELGFSYNYIHKLATGDKGLSINFKFRFITHFGWQEATKVFDTSELMQLAERSQQIVHATNVAN